MKLALSVFPKNTLLNVLIQIIKVEKNVQIRNRQKQKRKEQKLEKMNDIILNKSSIDFNDNDKLLFSHRLKFALTLNWTSFIEKLEWYNHIQHIHRIEWNDFIQKEHDDGNCAISDLPYKLKIPKFSRHPNAS